MKKYSSKAKKNPAVNAAQSHAGKSAERGTKSKRAAPIDAAQQIHGARPAQSQTLEASIGNQVRNLRKSANLTVMEMANQAGLSISMLSKIENGSTSPSLATLQAISKALNVPITTLFARFDEKRDVSYVASGQGLLIERRGTRSGHQYRLLGHSVASEVAVEPYLITLTEEADPYPVFQHEGVEFIYMLNGEVSYRHADKSYLLKSGDLLFFDASAPHGPEELRKLPMNYLSIIIYSQG